jgi:DNA (cytosine-5)-methyltransferase 3A
MKILSLFDGISCGRVALERAGMPVEVYYASEIDKYATQISQKNYPDIIRLGDVCKITKEMVGEVDMIIGGSPCQSFSNAGNRTGFEGKSGLFYEFVRLVKEIQPKYFLLENVKMKQEWQDIISEELGVKPIEINSSLVSGQSRKRLYWTNIPNVKLPEDKGIYLKDIITGLGEDITERMNKKIKGTLSYKKCWSNVRKLSQKAKTLTAGGQGISNSGATNILYNNGTYHKLTEVECERLQTLPDNYTQGVSSTQRYKAIGNGWTVDVIAHIFKNLTNN